MLNISKRNDNKTTQSFIRRGIAIAAMAFSFITAFATSVTYGPLTITGDSNGASVSACSADASGTVVIPNEVSLSGSSVPVTGISKRAFVGCLGIDSVRIGANVSEIGDYAFDGCESLRAVELDNIPVLSVGNCSFRNCSSLERVHWRMSGSEGGASSIGSSAFYGCTALSEFTLPGTVEQIGINAFSYCDNLKEVTALALSPIYLTNDPFANSAVTTVRVPFSVSTGQTKGLYENAQQWKRYTIQELDYTTEDISGLRYRNTSKSGEMTVSGHRVLGEQPFAITIPATVTLYDGSVSNVVSVSEGAFSGSEVLDIDVSRAIKLREIGARAFEKCNKIEQLTLIEGLTNMGENAFADCKALSSIKVPSTLKTLPKGAFKGCSVLTDIYINFGVLTLGDSTFARCTALEHISLPHSVSSISATTFNHTTNLRQIDVDDRDTKFASFAGILYALKTNGVPYRLVVYPAARDTVQYIIPYGVEEIGDFALQDAKTLRSLVMPATVKKMGKSCLDGCQVTSINNRATKPISITTQALGSFDAKKATLYVPLKSRTSYSTASVWRTFGSIELRDSVASDGKFSYDWTETGTAKLVDVLPTALEQSSVTLPKGIVLNEIDYPLTDIGGHAFDQVAGQLTELRIVEPELKNIDTENNPFTVCHKLNNVVVDKTANTSFSFSDGVLLNGDSTSIYYYPYSDQRTSFTIPSTVTSVFRQAFTGNQWLQELTCPNRLSTIGECAFEECTALQRVINGGSLVSLGRRAFAQCGALNNFAAGENISTIGDSAFFMCASLPHFAIAHSFARAVGNGAFEGCTALQSVVTGKALSVIGKRAYAGCTSLQLVTLSPALSAIGDEAFSGCVSLTDFRCRNFAPVSINDNVFTGVNRNTCLLSVPLGSKGYSMAAVWKTFTTQRQEYYIDNPADVNDDKTINVLDVSLVYEVILGRIGGGGITVYDVTRDGAVNVNDVTTIYGYILRGEDAARSIVYTYGSESTLLPLQTKLEMGTSLFIRAWNQVDEHWETDLSCINDNAAVLSTDIRNDSESHMFYVNAAGEGYATAILQSLNSEGVIYSRDFTVKVLPKSKP